MAKKRGSSPLGNAPGAQQAQQTAAKANLVSLTKQLSEELARAGEGSAHYLQTHFGLSSVGEPMVWQLASGNTATFTELTLSFSQVRDDTLVTFDVNGRDQNTLTSASLSDLDSLAFQQFYPAVGREVDGKIDILDGSRRRAWFLLQEGRIEEFRILVTQDPISVADAKALAKQLQTAKEHNLREIGLQCRALQQANPEWTQIAIAKQMGLSQAGVSKALKAASIDDALIQLFPLVNALSHPDYTVLAKCMSVGSNSESLQHFIEKVRPEIVNIQAEYDTQDQKDAIILALKEALKIVEAKTKTAKSQITALAEFETKGMFARKRVSGRNFAYEFGRLSKEIQTELDAAIAAILSKHQ